MEEQQEQILNKITEYTYLLHKNAAITKKLITGMTILVSGVGLLACILFGIIITGFIH